jgi:hypothetical protein
MPSAPLPQAQPEPSANFQPQAGNGEAHEAPAPTYFRSAAEPPQPSQPQATEATPARAPEEGWKTASGGGQMSAAPQVERTVESAMSSAPRAATLDEEEKLHNDARRFARLLVSEIKLYNEQKVSEGRRNNDLYDRLKEDIDRSRQMYEKRVTPSVAARFDYFYDELVNTLAEGDPGKLGSDHPGPSVAV